VKAQSYRSQTLRRVNIPKAGKPGETRPLGIPTLRDRVLMSAAKVVLGREENRGVLQYFIGPAELLDLLLEVLQLLALVSDQPRPEALVDLDPSNPGPKGHGRHAELGADRGEGRPLGGVFIPMLCHHTHGALTYLRGVPVGPWHFSILSRASPHNSGPIHLHWF
jgi:hypothetical protein